MNTTDAAEGSPVRRAIAGYVRLAARRPGVLVAALAVLAGAALAVAARLELRTDFAELLPPDHPAVVALRTIPPRQKSATNLVVLVSSPSQEANRRFAEALRPSLEAMVPRTFSELQWSRDTEVPEFAARWKWLYAERRDLEHAEELLDRVIAQRGNPLAADIGDEDPEAELRRLRERLSQKVPAAAPPSKYFEFQDPPDQGGQHLLGIMLWRKRDGLATRGDHETLAAVRDAVAAVDPARFDRAMRVEYTGHIAIAIDEQNGIRDDLTLATTVVLLLVLAVIWLYFGRLALVFVVGTPAILGALCALALAALTIQYLNINTAFLVSIILGNGINTPIMLLARYGEERRSGRAVEPSLTTALGATLLGTLTAMVGASIAYGCLLFTSFRGFSQFGLVGGSGMLIVWALSFLAVPPLVLLGERWWPGRLTPAGRLWRGPFAAIGRLAQRWPRRVALATGLTLALAAPACVAFVRDPIEWNIDKLRTDATPAQRLWARMDQLGMGDVGAGYIGNNAVFLVDRPEQADAVAEAVRAQDAAKGKGHVLKAVRTLASTLPADQDDKLELLARVRRKIDRHRALLSDDEERELAAWRPPDGLRRLGIEDLPRIVREAFTEIDGQRGRLIGVDADYASYSDWEGHDLLRMAKALTVEAEGKRWTAASAATVFAGMLETLLADGPRVSAAAAVGIVLLLLVMFGLTGAPLVLGCLAVGLVWWAALLEVLGVKINFMNFVALPITLGVGAEYAANLWARLRQDGTGRLADSLADTGSAVALCSLTTIIGYSSLLLSHNRALRSFGLAADLGELTTLVAALVALPAIALLRARKRPAVEVVAEEERKAS